MTSFELQQEKISNIFFNKAMLVKCYSLVLNFVKGMLVFDVFKNFYHFQISH